jgi:hypothetical protein
MLADDARSESFFGEKATTEGRVVCASTWSEQGTKAERLRQLNESKLTMSNRTKTFLLFGTLFLLLGLGNLIFGAVKHHQYQRVLRGYHELEKPIISSPQLVGGSPRKAIAAALTEQTKRKLGSRISFYRLVQHGGKVFLLFSGVLLLCAFVSNAKRGLETIA